MGFFENDLNILFVKSAFGIYFRKIFLSHIRFLYIKKVALLKNKATFFKILYSLRNLNPGIIFCKSRQNIFERHRSISIAQCLYPFLIRQYYLLVHDNHP